jgi:hypothetical protein
MGVLPDKQDPFFRILVLWMDIDVRIPFDSNTVSDVNIPGTVDHDSRLDIDVFSVGPECKPVLKVNEGIPESLLLHARAFLFQVAEKRPSAAFLSSLPVSSTGHAYCDVHPSTSLADSPTHRRGRSRSLFVATPLSGLPA